MNGKLYESELKVMNVLWREGEISAKRVAEMLREEVGWSKTTSYTVLRKCVDKGAVERMEPGFVCRAKVSREDVRRRETDELIDRMYCGRADLLVAALLDGGRLGPEALARLRALAEGTKE